jgi:hypothetical protein
MDSIQDLLSGDCRVVCKAQEGFFRALTLVHPLSLASSFLAQLADLTSRTRKTLLWLATLFFNWSMFHARRRLFMTLNSPPTLERAVRTLISSTTTHWNKFVRISKNKFIKRLAVDFVSMKLVQPLRAPSSKKKKTPTDPTTLAAISSPPPGTYLDGSAAPNPGPTGAGAVLFWEGAVVVTPPLATPPTTSGNCTRSG